MATRFLTSAALLLLFMQQQQQRQQQGVVGFKVAVTPSRLLSQQLSLTKSSLATSSMQQQQQQQLEKGDVVVSRHLANSSSSSSSSISSTTAAAAAAAATSDSVLKGPLPLDLRGKIAFVAGVADSNGYGWAICKMLRAAGARVLAGTWPPVYWIFKKGLESQRFQQDSRYSQEETAEAGGDTSSTEALAASQLVSMDFEKVFPLDAAFDTPQDVPPEVASNKRYSGVGGFTISETAAAVEAEFGKIDYLVHSLANGPEVTRPLLKTSRRGYLDAVSSSSYSFVSLLQHFLPLMKPGGSALTLSYVAAERVVPGYGGGMSSAKAALESDCRSLAFEAGRSSGVRVNCISAGPLKSRAATAIGKTGDRAFIDLAINYSKANAPLSRDLESDDVGKAALFLLSPLAQAVTGTTLYVDNGLHSMAQALDSRALSV